MPKLESGHAVSPIVAAKEVMNGATVTKLQKGNLAARMELSEMVISAGKLLANEVDGQEGAVRTMCKRLREQEVEFEEKDAQLESLQKEVKIIKSDFGRTRREFSNLQSITADLVQENDNLVAQLIAIRKARRPTSASSARAARSATGSTG